MVRTVVASVAMSSFALVLFEPAEAHAIPPVNVEAGFVVGYATNPGTREPLYGFAGPNPLGVGFGARGGLEFSNHIYAGVNVINYFGATTQYNGDALHESTLLVGLDVGYSVHLAFLTIRPQAGLGEATITSIDYLGPSFEGTEQAFTSSTTHLYGCAKDANQNAPVGTLRTIAIADLERAIVEATLAGRHDRHSRERQSQPSFGRGRTRRNPSRARAASDDFSAMRPQTQTAVLSQSCVLLGVRAELILRAIEAPKTATQIDRGPRVD